MKMQCSTMFYNIVQAEKGKCKKKDAVINWFELCAGSHIIQPYQASSEVTTLELGGATTAITKYSQVPR